MSSLNNSLNVPLPANNGELWIGNTGNLPSVSALTAGTGISITNGAGSITIATSLTLANVLPDSATFVPLVAGTIYISTNVVSGATTFVLPTSPVVGDIFKIVGYGSAGWTLTQNALQTIIVGNHQSMVGTGGSVSSMLATDSIDLYCVTTTNFVAIPDSGQVIIV